MSSPDERALEAQLPRSPDSGAVARRLIAEHFGALLRTQALGDAKLVVSELVNNAYMHGRGRIRMLVRLAGNRLRIEVTDEGRGASVRIREPANDLAGRGLRIVDDIATTWGASGGPTIVWAELTV